MEESKKIKVEFAPGCFDQFDGTQEELDALMAMIIEMAESGELEDNSQDIDMDELDPDTKETLQQFLEHDGRPGHNTRH